MSTQSENYLIKALHNAKIEQLADNYKQRGFIVDEKAGDHNFDLILRNDTTNQVIAFEIETLPLSQDAFEQIQQLKDQAKALGYEFRLVTISRPKKLDVEINWFNEALLNYLVSNEPIELRELGAEVLKVRKVEADIDSLFIEDNKALINAAGSIEVAIPKPESSHIFGTDLYTVLPFDGEFNVDMHSRQIINGKFHVDTSEWDK
ncbi:MAG: hypothetical protein V7641_1362 [Blastocatellia bacterium]